MESRAMPPMKVHVVPTWEMIRRIEIWAAEWDKLSPRQKQRREAQVQERLRVMGGGGSLGV